MRRVDWMSQPPADDPFRHGEVDGPASAHSQRSAELTLYAFEQEIGQMGQRLCAGPEAEKLSQP